MQGIPMVHYELSPHRRDFNPILQEIVGRQVPLGVLVERARRRMEFYG
jgi:hypothetical protein